MYRFLKNSSLTAATLTTPLFAHSGEHHTFTASHFTGHLLTTLAIIAIPASLAFLGYKFLRKSKA